MTWKLSLYDFIHARNQTEMDYEWNALRRHTVDEQFLALAAARQERRREQHRRRGIALSRSETRLRVSRIESGPNEMTVDISLHYNLETRCGGRAFSEERVELEQLVLARKGSSEWTITGVHGHPLADQDSRMAVQEADPPPAYDTPPPPFLSSGLSASSFARKSAVYDREQARQYAERYWDSHNPAFLLFDVDCSNYVSQCVLAGGHRMNYTGQRGNGWWYRGRNGSQELWSYSWAVANALQVYLGGRRSSGLRAVAVDSPKELEIGDVICYSWDGNGRYGHSTVVTGFDSNGMPLVNAHTVNSRGRYWDYSDSYAWTERTQYRLYHIMEP